MGALLLSAVAENEAEVTARPAPALGTLHPPPCGRAPSCPRKALLWAGWPGCCSRGEVILSLGGEAPRRNQPGLHLGADVTHPAGLLPARPPVGSSKGHIPGCGPLPHHLVESPGRPWDAGAAGRAVVQGEGGAVTLQVWTPRTRCVDSPKLGAATSALAPPYTPRAPRGPQPVSRMRMAPPLRLSAPTLCRLLLGRIYFIFRTGPGDG